MAGGWVRMPTLVGACGQLWPPTRPTRHPRAMQANDRMPFDDKVPFTRAEARVAGISAKALRSGRYQRLFHDLYLSAEIAATPAVRAKAVLKVCPPGTQVSHFSAAELWGAIVPSQPLTHVSCPQPGVRSQRGGVGSHRLNRDAHTVRFRGIRMSGPEQTFIDLACVLPLVDLVVLGDSLVKAKRTTVDRLAVAVDAWAGSGSRPARRAAGFVRLGVDSPMETRLRMLMVLAGLPEPVVNHIQYDANGGWAKRFDLSYPDLRLLIEYDGRHHAEDEQQWNRDIDRREELDGDAWRLIVIQSKGIYVEPQRTLARIADAMRVRGARNVPARFRDEWRTHFPGRSV